MAFNLTEADLASLFTSASFAAPQNEMVFFGLRGCSPVDADGTGFAGSHAFEMLGVDYLHMRCTIGQWKPGSGFAVFPGSTVPYARVVKEAAAKGGGGVNQLAMGFMAGDHRYAKGDHKLGNPSSRHRAFRNDSPLPVWRTADDADYDGDDVFDVQVVYDNIHCAWQQNVAAPSFSSNGCQVIAGRPRVEARGWTEELGPWAKFVAGAYGIPQKRFCYALFSGREALRAATLGPGGRAPTVRFGSSGELVEAVQQALVKAGYDLGKAGANGEMSLRTLRAIQEVQRKAFGPASVDLVVGPATAAALGLSWPAAGDGAGGQAKDAWPAKAMAAFAPPVTALNASANASVDAPTLPKPARSDGSLLDEIRSLAIDLGVEPEALTAVTMVESSGKLYDWQDRPLIRWEGHYFHARLDGDELEDAIARGLASNVVGGVPNPKSQKDRYALLARARLIDDEAALESCSWGAGQVMGANWKALGFGSVMELVERCHEGAVGQVEVMARFIRANNLVDELVDHDWRAFTRAYNGKGGIKNGYHEQMRSWYEKLVAKGGTKRLKAAAA